MNPLLSATRPIGIRNRPTDLNGPCHTRTGQVRGRMAVTWIPVDSEELLGVPAKIVYYTNGRTRALKLGPYSIKLLNRGPKTMDVGGRVAPLVFQALCHLGRSGVTPDVVDRLRSALSAKDKAELKANIGYAPAWMIPVIEQVASTEGN